MIRPLRSGTPGPSTPVGPRVTKRMMAEACRSLVQSRHPRSLPIWPEGTVHPADAAGAWTQEEEGEALREPPAVRRETSSTPKPREEGSPRGPEPQPGGSKWSPILVALTEGQPDRGRTKERRHSGRARDEGAAGVTITSSAD